MPPINQESNTKTSAMIAAEEIMRLGISRKDIVGPHIDYVYKRLKRWGDAPDFSAICETLSFVKREKKDCDSPLFGVIVETRCNPALEFVVNSFSRNLVIKIQLFHGKQNADFIMSTTIANLVSAGDVILSELNTDTLGASAYNALLLSQEFWECMIGRRKILIFQPDAVFCKKSDYKIEDFISFDYIGSEWARHRPIGLIVDGGSGGVSLRDWNMAHECLTRFPPQIWCGGEDGYFAFHLDLMGCKIGRGVECAKFSTQNKFYFNSLFAHKISCLRSNDKSKFLEYCPEAAYMIEE